MGVKRNDREDKTERGGLGKERERMYGRKRMKGKGKGDIGREGEKKSEGKEKPGRRKSVRVS